MDTTPLISVITVCRNSGESLAHTLRSVGEQDWPHIEHIVIDGASIDGTVEIIERFRSKLAHFSSQPDKNLYDAMNKGLDCASGDIICFLHAKDYYVSSTVLSRVASQMREFGLDALIACVEFFHEVNPERMVRRYRSGIFKPELLAWGWMPAHPALFLSRSVVQRVGHFKVDYQIASDFEFIVRAFHGHNLKYQYLPDVVVRMPMGGISTKSWGSSVSLNREVLRACRENGLCTNMLKILSKYPVKIFLEIILKFIKF